jgi:hypothetical protein
VWGDVSLSGGMLPNVEGTLSSSAATIGGFFETNHPWIRPSAHVGVGVFRTAVTRAVPSETLARYEAGLRVGFDLHLKLAAPIWISPSVGVDLGSPQPVLVQGEKRGDIGPVTLRMGVGLHAAF